MYKQLTIRMSDKELERAINQLARSEGISLNQAVLRILRRGAGLSRPGVGGNVVGSALDGLAGTWSEEESRAFEEALSDLEKPDGEFWP
jgi:hypothetical protein